MSTKVRLLYVPMIQINVAICPSPDVPSPFASLLLPASVCAIHPSFCVDAGPATYRESPPHASIVTPQGDQHLLLSGVELNAGSSNLQPAFQTPAVVPSQISGSSAHIHSSTPSTSYSQLTQASALDGSAWPTSSMSVSTSSSSSSAAGGNGYSGGAGGQSVTLTRAVKTEHDYIQPVYLQPAPASRAYYGRQSNQSPALPSLFTFQGPHQSTALTANRDGQYLNSDSDACSSNREALPHTHPSYYLQYAPNCTDSLYYSPSGPSTSRQATSHTAPAQEWSHDDTLCLIHVLNEVDGRSWNDIAKRAFPNLKYTANQCQAKWKQLSKEKKPVNRGPWTQDEDEALLEAVNMLNPDKWVVIATQVEGRNGKQCRERWYNHLSPSSRSTH